MASHNPHEVEHHVTLYLRVFYALMVLTVVTVAVGYLKLQIVLAVTAALTIAVLKGSLVASFFMHLFWERRIIFACLVLTIALFAFLMVLPIATSGPIHADGEGKVPVVYGSQ